MWSGALGSPSLLPSLHITIVLIITHLSTSLHRLIYNCTIGMISCLRRPERARERGEDKGLGLKETVVIHKSTDDDAVNYQ